MHFKRAMSRTNSAVGYQMPITGLYHTIPPTYQLGEFVIFCDEVFVITGIDAFDIKRYRIFNKGISEETIIVPEKALKPCPIDRKVLAEVVREEKYTLADSPYWYTNMSCSTHAI